MSKAFEDSEHTNQWIKSQLHSSSKRRGWNVRVCAETEERKNRQQSFKESLVAQDAKLRQQIHQVIREMKVQGKSKLEVIFALNKRPEFKQYSRYFKIWIENDYSEKTSKTPWASKVKISEAKEEER